MGTPSSDGPRRYAVALSFAGEDRPYVEAVASSLRKAGISVFYDVYEEATLWGKNLYTHLSSVYGEQAEFTVMFVSRAYASKLWPNHERESAQARAFGERREYILPARFDDTDVPGLLGTTAYVDLRNKQPDELARLIVQKLETAGFLAARATDERLSIDELRRRPLLASALAEIDSGGPTDVMAEAILSSSLPARHIRDFLMVAAETAEGYALLRVGQLAIECIDRFDVGHEAFDRCLQPGRLADDQLSQLGMALKGVTRPAAVLWAHGELTSRLRLDRAYHMFLDKHLPAVMESAYDDMAAYLLFPDRGPAGFNLDSLFLVSASAADPSPFTHRLREWVREGYLDGRSRRRQNEEAVVLYRMLNRVLLTNSTHPLRAVADAAIERTRECLRTESLVPVAMYHLISMLRAQFVAVETVRDRVLHVLPDSRDEKARQLFWLVDEAFTLLPDVLRDGEHSAASSAFHQKMTEIFAADSISGFTA